MDAVRVMRLALGVITDRLLTILALLMTFALACWVMHEPTLERLGTAVMFAVFSCLVTRKEKKDEKVSDGDGA